MTKTTDYTDKLNCFFTGSIRGHDPKGVAEVTTRKKTKMHIKQKIIMTRCKEAQKQATNNQQQTKKAHNT